MKNITSSLLLFLCVCGGGLTSSCDSKKEPLTTEVIKRATSESGKPYLNFDKEKHDFGSIDGNDKKKEFITTDFIFVNESEKPIIIQKADVSCGCVSTEIPSKPILKGEKGVVKVTLDVKQLSGHFDKQVFVKTNAENDVELLRVTGSVKR